jgi:hypothetical protein
MDAGFTNGTCARVIYNAYPEPDDPIVERIEWINSGGPWPLEILETIIRVWQLHSDYHTEEFEQTATLPGGVVICLRFRPKQKPVVCKPSSSNVIGKGLFDAVLTKIVPDTPEDFREAIRRAIQPEKLAAILEKSTEEARKLLKERTVRRTEKIIVSKPKNMKLVP